MNIHRNKNRYNVITFLAFLAWKASQGMMQLNHLGMWRQTWCSLQYRMMHINRALVRSTRGHRNHYHSSLGPALLCLVVLCSASWHVLYTHLCAIHRYSMAKLCSVWGGKSNVHGARMVGWPWRHGQLGHVERGRCLVRVAGAVQSLAYNYRVS